MLEAGAMLLFCAVLFASVALGWSIIPALFVAARDGEPCGRQRTVRGDRGGDLRAHRRTDLAVEG